MVLYSVSQGKGSGKIVQFNEFLEQVKGMLIFVAIIKPELSESEVTAYSR